MRVCLYDSPAGLRDQVDRALEGDRGDACSPVLLIHEDAGDPVVGDRVESCLVLFAVVDVRYLRGWAVLRPRHRLVAVERAGGSSTSSEGARGDGAIRLAVSTTSNVPVAHADETGLSARERLGTISSENARVLAHRIAEAGSLTSYPFDSRFTFGSIVALLLIVKLVGSR